MLLYTRTVPVRIYKKVVRVIVLITGTNKWGLETGETAYFFLYPFLLCKFCGYACVFICFSMHILFKKMN